VTIDSQLLTSRIQNDAGLPSGSQFGPLLAQIPHTRSLQEANDPRDINDSFSIGYNIRQNLAEDWKITNRFRYNQGHWASNQLAGAGLQNNLTTANRISQVNDSSSHTFATNIDLNGRFDAIGGAHNFLF
jgi:iron complex outermembrane receptor protein